MAVFRIPSYSHIIRIENAALALLGIFWVSKIKQIFQFAMWKSNNAEA